MSLLFAAVCSAEEPGAGHFLQETGVTLQASAHVRYDSNVYLTRDHAQDDSIFGVEYGAGMAHKLDWYSLEASLLGCSEWYDSLTDLDHTDFRDTLSLSMKTDGGTRFRLGQAFSYADALAYVTLGVQRTKINQVDVGAERSLTEKIDGYLRCDFRSHQYETPLLYDWNETDLSGSAAYRITPKTATFLSASVGIEDASGNSSGGTCYNSLLGVKSKSTDKMTVQAGVGVLGLSSDADTITEPSYKGTIWWRLMDGLTLALDANKYIQPAVIVRDNYLTVDSLTARAKYSLGRSVDLTLWGNYRHQKLDRPYAIWDGTVEKKEDVLLGGLRIEYGGLSRFFRCYLEGTTTDQDSTVDAWTHTVHRLLAGIHFQY